MTLPPVKTVVPPQAAAIYESYLACLAGRGVGNKTFDSGARCFLARYPDPQAWAGLPLDQRLRRHPAALAAAAELPNAAPAPAAGL